MVIGQLDVAVLSELFSPELTGAKDTHIIAVDQHHRLVYDTAMGKVNAAELLANGSLKTTVDSTAVTAALAGKKGSVRVTDGRTDTAHRGQS
jgi:hypothetical protein